MDHRTPLIQDKCLQDPLFDIPGQEVGRDSVPSLSTNTSLGHQSICCEASVRSDDLRRDVAGALHAEERYHAAHFVRVRPSLHRGLLSNLVHPRERHGQSYVRGFSGLIADKQLCDLMHPGMPK